MELYKLDENYSDSVFKKEWNWLETKGLEVVLNEWLKENRCIKETADEYFGLAYTSSSSYALLGVCNVRHYLDEGIYISHFALTENAKIVFVCKDKEEKYYHFVLDNFCFSN